MRWLLLKDLQILRRSPLLVGLLALYAVVIGLPVGYAVSRPPAKPKVALFSAVPPSASAFSVGSRRLDTQTYAERLFDAIDPVRVHSRAAAIAKVRSGEALAALVIPADVTRALQSALSLNARTKPPTLEVYYNAENPLKRRYVENTINAQLAKANQALSAELTKTAARDIQILLRGGGFSILGKRFDILGLQRSAAVLGSVARALPANDPRRRAVEQVRRFAQLAIDNLDLTGPVLASIATPIRAQVNSVDGRTSSLDGFAVAAAVTVAVMVIGLLIAAGMLALEREEHAYGRLVRGLVSRTGLVAEKAALGALGAAVTGLLLLVLLSAFRSVDYARAPGWLAALAVGALGFGAMGVAIGALTRDVRASSLLAFLLTLPVAALALVPAGTVGGVAFDAIRTISALFPFKATLQALDAGLNGAAPGLGAPLAHLAALTIGYLALARLALARFTG